MRILLVHNYYGSSAPSGENKVFEAERAMLERHGHEVRAYTRHSDEIRNGTIWGLIKGALCTTGNPFAARTLARLCREFKPDVVHFHNTFPLISPLSVRAASKYAPVVMTLHNYRMVCAAGTPTRCGKVCRECFDEKGRCSIWPAIRHRCYRGRLLATVPLAINIWLYRRLLRKWVSKFIVLSESQKQRMMECGIIDDKIVVKGNFVNLAPANAEQESKEDLVVYVGRLSDEKGIRTLIKAWGMLEKSDGESQLKLAFIGDGIRRKEYEDMAQEMSIEFLGKKSEIEVRKEMAKAKVMVCPSECWETFGLSVVEAMGEGTPVVVSDQGALPNIVRRDCGVIFKSGDANALAAAIQAVINATDYDKMCEAAKNRAEDFSEEANYRQLMGIYLD